MSYRYSNISLTQELQEYTINGTANEISGLSFINIFVGENNAGKSRFMRELSKTDQSDFLVKGIEFKDLRTQYDLFMQTFGPVWDQLKVTIADCKIGTRRYQDLQAVDLGAFISTRFNPQFFDPNADNPQTLKNLLVSIRDSRIDVISQRGGNYRVSLMQAQRSLKEDYANVFLDFLDVFGVQKLDYDKYYIPMLRSLNNFSTYLSDSNQDIFRSRVAEVYKFAEVHNVDIFTGQTLYERIKAMLLGDIEERNRIRKYERFLSEKLFDEREVVIIPKIGQDVLNVKIGEDERPIYELGDGIQSLIILTFPLFESKRGLFFIEEPETNMHPGMQRKFLEALHAHPQHQYFITTHSNHLLDLTIDFSDISIFTFEKRADRRLVEVVTTGNKNILDLIGARSSSVFLANKSIWVEGVTDRLYLRKFMSLYIQENDLPVPREDIDHIFIEYGGNNITHWSFLDSTDPTINVDRISQNLMVVTDQDGSSKMDRKTALKKKLGKRYHLLEEREIENILSLGTLLDVVGKYEKSDMSAMIVDASTIKTEPIGRFIEKEIFSKNGLKQKRRGSYSDKSGTVSSKLDFCHKAIDSLKYQDLTPSALKIAKKLYDFIYSSSKA